MNNIHPLIFELQKLKESSKEAVADGNTAFNDQLKRFLHVERPIEKVIKEIIKNTYDAPLPTLLLVCGNVGDGKSHLLSTLKQDPEIAGCLNSFQIHNDATESFNPDETCIETLRRILTPFADKNLGTVSAKQILAINLGTLSNFLEENKQGFSKFKSFVEEQGIIELSHVQEADCFQPDQIFQSVNFTTYHFFDLTEQGASAGLIEKLLAKVTKHSEANPLYVAYRSIKGVNWSINCPIKLNYEFLCEEHNRKVIANLLVQSMLKEKQIISFRQVLNFIHDLIVPYEIEVVELDSYLAGVDKLNFRKRLQIYTPYFIFDHPQLSKVFYALHKIDPCTRRNEKLDDIAIQLHSSINPVEVFYQHLNLNQSYLERQIMGAVGESKDQEVLFKLFLRLAYFKLFYDPIYQDDYFLEFTHALFYFNKSDASGLKKSIELVQSAALKWNGSAYEKDKVILPVKAQNNQYRVLRSMKIRPILPQKKDFKIETILHQFSPELSLNFLEAGTNASVAISIDYKLFVLLQRIHHGYRPNKLDRNNHVNFVRFVDRMITADAEHAEIYLDEVNIGKNMDYKLLMNDFGEFTFERL